MYPNELICPRCAVYRPTVLFDFQVYCTVCHYSVAHWRDTPIPFGKYKGRLVYDMTAADELRYFAWAVGNVTSLTNELRTAMLVQMGAITCVTVSPVPQVWWAEMLSLPTRFSKAEIKASYRSLSKRLHPDMGGSDAAMQLLNEARTCADNAATY